MSVVTDLTYIYSNRDPDDVICCTDLLPIPEIRNLIIDSNSCGI